MQNPAQTFGGIVAQAMGSDFIFISSPPHRIGYNMKRKSIRELAAEIGVSKQAIYKRITREPLRSLIQANVYKTAYKSAYKTVNRLYVDEVGETLIKRAFQHSASHTEPHTKSSTDVYTATIKILHEQLIAKDKQIAELSAMVKMLAMGTIRKPKRKRIKLNKSTEMSAPIRRLINSKS